MYIGGSSVFVAKPEASEESLLALVGSFSIYD